MVRWCDGAMVAKQIVKRLLAQGHEVESFIAIDAQAPDLPLLNSKRSN
jgi:thioesterase domain-containing protein